MVLTWHTFTSACQLAYTTGGLHVHRENSENRPTIHEPHEHTHRGAESLRSGLDDPRVPSVSAPRCHHFGDPVPSARKLIKADSNSSPSASVPATVELLCPPVPHSRASKAPGFVPPRSLDEGPHAPLTKARREVLTIRAPICKRLMPRYRSRSQAQRAISTDAGVPFFFFSTFSTGHSSAWQVKHWQYTSRPSVVTQEQGSKRLFDHMLVPFPSIKSQEQGHGPQ